MSACRSGRVTTAAVVAMVGMGLVAGVGCGGGSKAGGSTPATSGGAGSGQAKTVTATETEFKIVLSRTTFSPGHYMFTAVNKGKVGHSLEIDGPGVSNERIAGTVSPGQSKSLTVTLKSGSYDVFCPVDGHKGLGMDVQIHVGGGRSGGMGGSGTGGSTTSSRY